MPNSMQLLQATGITKQFPGVLALEDVSFDLRAGEVHALMGENGAGKSTLIKILTGFYTRDAGGILLGGQPIDPTSPGDAQQLGISTVYQEVNLVPQLTIAENLLLGRLPRRFDALKGLGGCRPINWPETRRRAQKIMGRLGLGNEDVSRPLSDCSVALQQMVAIARAVDFDAKVLILDEPTSSLDTAEVAQLFETIRQLKSQGLGVIIVTHFLDQVYAISDRITVLRNGRWVGTYDTPTLPRLALVSAMVGKDASTLTAHHPPAANTSAADRQVVLSAEGLARKNAIEPFNLTLRAGEVVGLAGLLGSGRTEAARLLFGADKPGAGTITIGEQKTRLRSPRAAIARGIAFTSEDRKLDGIIPDLSVRENIVLALQARRGWLRRIPKRSQRALADKYIAALGIRTPDAEKSIKLLSGGNQQKALLARWLATEPKLLILDEPTRGIDVGAKVEVTKLIDSLCADGMSLLFISGELEEIARSCQRVCVLRDRRFVGELAGAAVTESAILAAIAGTGGDSAGNSAEELARGAE